MKRRMKREMSGRREEKGEDKRKKNIYENENGKRKGLQEREGKGI